MWVVLDLVRVQSHGTCFVTPVLHVHGNITYFVLFIYVALASYARSSNTFFNNNVNSQSSSTCEFRGTEMEEWHNHLLPGDKRHTRAKSHLFSVALTPNGRPESFDVEYILQLEIGGKIPKFMVAPIVSESVKNMFKHAKDVFGGRDGEIDAFIAELKAKQAQEVKVEATASTTVEDVMTNAMPRQLVRTS